MVRGMDHSPPQKNCPGLLPSKTIKSVWRLPVEKNGPRGHPNGEEPVNPLVDGRSIPADSHSLPEQLHVSHESSIEDTVPSESQRGMTRRR